MKISKKELIEMGASDSLINRFSVQTGGSEEEFKVKDLVGGEPMTYEDFLWIAIKSGIGVYCDCITEFAKKCALINIELIKPYTDKYEMIVDALSIYDFQDTIYAEWSTFDALKEARRANDDHAYFSSHSANEALRLENFDWLEWDDYPTYGGDAACFAVKANPACKEQVDKYLLELFYGEEYGNT